MRIETGERYNLYNGDASMCAMSTSDTIGAGIF